MEQKHTQDMLQGACFQFQIWESVYSVSCAADQLSSHRKIGEASSEISICPGESNITCFPQWGWWNHCDDWSGQCCKWVYIFSPWHPIWGFSPLRDSQLREWGIFQSHKDKKQSTHPTNDAERTFWGSQIFTTFRLVPLSLWQKSVLQLLTLDHHYSLIHKDAKSFSKLFSLLTQCPCLMIYFLHVFHSEGFSTLHSQPLLISTHKLLFWHRKFTKKNISPCCVKTLAPNLNTVY